MGKGEGDVWRNGESKEKMEKGLGGTAEFKG